MASAKRTREQHNAKRRERYAADSEYREKALANRRAWKGKSPKRTPEQEIERNARRREQYATDVAFREESKKSAKEWAANNVEKRFAQNLRRYGISPADYQKMYDEQKGLCAVCDRWLPSSDGRVGSFRGRNDRLHVDHCHTTGRVRGLLCHRCNVGIGQLDDDPARMERAALYLRRRS